MSAGARSRSAARVGRAPAVADQLAAAARGVLPVYINEGFLPMVDGALVYHRGFGDRPTSRTDPAPSLTLAPHVFTAAGDVEATHLHPIGAAEPPLGRPRARRQDPAHRGQYLVRRGYWGSFLPEATLVAEAGSTIRLQVHNTLTSAHRLTVHGVGGAGSDATTGDIPPGRMRELTLPAPAPGTYLFSDPTNDPVERTLGLAGVLMVTPGDQWRLDDNGTEFERQWVWLCRDVEPRWARLASLGRTVVPATTPAVPRYFTINGRSGFQALAVSTDVDANHHRDEETNPSGSARHVDVRDFSRRTGRGTVGAGQLIRMVNAGIVAHQMHFHGNHVWTVRRNGNDFPRSIGRIDEEGHVLLQQWEDVVELDPMDRKEIVLPLERPPDAIDPVWDARAGDWAFPMHCHAEPSQTAAGGLYPGGMVADWKLAAPTSGGIG